MELGPSVIPDLGVVRAMLSDHLDFLRRALLLRCGVGFPEDLLSDGVVETDLIGSAKEETDCKREICADLEHLGISDGARLWAWSITFPPTLSEHQQASSRAL